MTALLNFAYYNEHDPRAAAWLRELIKAGEIMPGEVDERSIVDVEASDLVGFTRCHFFAGIGGWELALRIARWPVDREVWTGSCPCQPFSVAGKGAGATDARHLWPAWFRLIAIHTPPYVFGEQVASAVKHGWLDLVCDDLEGIGYSCGAIVLPAASVGAPHKRERLWFVANSQRGAAERRRHDLGVPAFGTQSETRERQWVRADTGASEQPDELADSESIEHERSSGARDWRSGDPDRQSTRGVAESDTAERRTDVAGGHELDGRSAGRNEGDGEHGTGGEARSLAHGAVPRRGNTEDTGTDRSHSGPMQVGGERESGIRESERSGADGRMAHSDGGNTSAEREQRGGQQRLKPADGGLAVGLADSNSGGFLEQRSGGLLDGERQALGNDADGCGEVGGVGDSNRSDAAEIGASYPAIGEQWPIQRWRPEQFAGDRTAGRDGGRDDSAGTGGRSDGQDEGRAGDSDGHAGVAQGDAGSAGLEGRELGGSRHDERHRPQAHGSTPEPGRSFWSDCEWIWCRDGKWRPVVARLALLADGVSSNLDACCAEAQDQGEVTYGTTEIAGSIEALRVLREADDETSVRSSTRGPRSFQPQEVLRSEVHDVGDDRDHQGGGSHAACEPQSFGKDRKAVLREMRQDRKTPRSPLKRGPTGQHTLKFADFVSLLPSAIALAELESDNATAEGVRSLLATIAPAWPLLHAPHEIQALWESADEETQDRLYVGAIHRGFVRHYASPLVRPSKQFSRTTMLRGFGNAIVPELAAEVIMATMEGIE